VKTGLASDIPLMSRDEELSRVLLGLQGPESAAFVLAGPAGVGKTRLAAEVARSVARLGFVAVSAVASRTAAAIPFGPFARFLPEAGLASGGLTGLLRQAGDAILALAGEDRKLLLTVDDAQFLDPGSAALVHQLALERACSLLVSLRTPDPAPDLVTALWKDGLAERIELGAWAEPEIAAVVSAFLGGPVAGETVRRLWELSQGNALYLRELLIGAVQSQALTESGGIWALHRSLAAPGRLVELVAARLAGLPPETVTVIETLAVGESLGLATLEAVTSPDGVEDAEAQGLVWIEQDGRRTLARLSHPVYGEVLRQSMPRSRLRRLSASLAESMQTSGARRRDDLLRLARWQLDSGRPGEPGLLSQAARRASEVFDLQLAERLARAAMDAGGTPEAGLVLGETRFRSGQYAEAESVLAATVALCRTDGEVARIASARAYNLYTNLGDGSAATAVLDQALTVIDQTAPRLELLGRLAMIKLFELDLDGAVAAAEPLLASDDDVVVSRGSYVSSIGLAWTGRTEDALAVAYLGLEAHRRAIGHPQLPEAQLIGAFFGHLGAGRLAQAESEAATGYRVSLSAHDLEGAATHLLLTGWAAIERGEAERASAAFLEAATMNREINDLVALRWSLAGCALAEAMRGNADRARAAQDELMAMAPAKTMLIYEPELIERSRAWVSVAVGELSRAREILTSAADRAAEAGLRIGEARLRHDLARLGHPGQVAPRLAELAAQVDGELVPALAAHAAALASGKAADLEAAGHRLESIGAALLAAEAFLAAAASFRSAGLGRPAAALTARATALLARCGDVQTPGLASETLAGRLTKRELEIAAMATAGAASREIAAKLVLSVRTVDNHLQNVYAKLGVTGREELTAALRSGRLGGG
jgi:DNA-binding CsgD family transcriptional regulator